VRDKLDKARERLNAGAPPKDATNTVGDWLKHWRATTLAVSDRKESTRTLYATLCRKHLEPAPFGAITLDKLKPSDVEALVLAMRTKTKPARRDDDAAEPRLVRALSDSTIRQVYTIARAALDGAVRDGLLARNPAAAVKRPGIARHEARHLDAADVAALLKATQTSRHHTALVLIAATGLRKGEALALRWDRVDLTAGTIRVAATIARIDHKLVISEPKTERSSHTVPLPATVVAMLRKHRTEQKAERLRVGDQWTDTGLVSPQNSVRRLIRATCCGWLRPLRRAPATTVWACTRCATRSPWAGHSTDTAARSAVDGWSSALGL
jgi:integrase